MGSFLYLSFMMLDDPDLGNFQIVANRQSGTPVTKSIKVEQYGMYDWWFLLSSTVG